MNRSLILIYNTVRRPYLESPLAEILSTSKFFWGPDLIALYFSLIQPPYIVIYTSKFIHKSNEFQGPIALFEGIHTSFPQSEFVKDDVCCQSGFHTFRLVNSCN